MVITQARQQPTLPRTSNDGAARQQSCADLVKEFQLDDGCEGAAVVQPRITGRGKTVRIALLSDVHLEFGDRPLPAPDADAYDILVTAGDIGPVPLAIERLKSLSKPVVYVLGNHERYHRDCHEVVLEAKALAKDSQVYVLE
jgi:hypothetical protein